MLFTSYRDKRESEREEGRRGLVLVAICAWRLLEQQPPDRGASGRMPTSEGGEVLHLPGRGSLNRFTHRYCRLHSITSHPLSTNSLLCATSPRYPSAPLRNLFHRPQQLLATDCNTTAGHLVASTRSSTQHNRRNGPVIEDAPGGAGHGRRRRSACTGKIFPVIYLPLSRLRIEARAWIAIDKSDYCHHQHCLDQRCPRPRWNGCIASILLCRPNANALAPTREIVHRDGLARKDPSMGTKRDVARPALPLAAASYHSLCRNIGPAGFSACLMFLVDVE